MSDHERMEHTREDDGEVLGEIVEEGGGWVALDRLGRRLSGPTDLAEARAALEDLGLDYLAGRYELDTEDGAAMPVRIVEVGPDRVRVRLEDGDAIDGPARTWDLPNPVPAAFRPR
jgi:hypothetical protein